MGGRLARNGNSEPRQPLLSLSAAPCGRNNHKYVSRSRIIIAQGTQGQIIASRRVSGRSDPPIPCPPSITSTHSSFNTSDSVLSPPEASSTLPTLLVNNRVPNLAAGPAHDAPTLAMLFDGRTPPPLPGAIPRAGHHNFISLSSPPNLWNSHCSGPVPHTPRTNGVDMTTTYTRCLL